MVQVDCEPREENVISIGTERLSEIFSIDLDLLNVFVLEVDAISLLLFDVCYGFGRLFFLFLVASKEFISFFLLYVWYDVSK